MLIHSGYLGRNTNDMPRMRRRRRLRLSQVNDFHNRFEKFVGDHPWWTMLLLWALFLGPLPYTVGYLLGYL